MQKNIVKICHKHGELMIEDVHKEINKKLKKGYFYRCNQCKLEKDRRYKDNNREQHNKTACQARNEARKLYREGLTNEEPKANVWGRNDRKNDPEKYRQYDKNYIKKHGIEKIRKYEVARIHGLSIEQYDDLIKSHNNLCATCGKPETRLGRDGKTITPLSVDHCHTCEEKGHHVIRGLLCHACNTAMGKLKDNIDTLRNIINYLDKHKHKE